MMTCAGTPTVSASTPFTLGVTAAEGQRGGCIFYGTGGADAQPWSSTSTSFLCVKSPRARTGAQDSGGSLGLCDGSLQLDWNAFAQAHPGALGFPAQVGQRFWVQAWLRDPFAPRTSNLSDALTFQVCP